MAEAIQQLILDTLDKEGVIKDTRTLVLPGYKEPAATHDSQIIILGALNSLTSRDVHYSMVDLCQETNVSLDDHVHYPRDRLPCSHPGGRTNCIAGFARSACVERLPSKGRGPAAPDQGATGEGWPGNCEDWSGSGFQKQVDWQGR